MKATSPTPRSPDHEALHSRQPHQTLIAQEISIRLMQAVSPTSSRQPTMSSTACKTASQTSSLMNTGGLLQQPARPSWALAMQPPLHATGRAREGRAARLQLPAAHALQALERGAREVARPGQRGRARVAVGRPCARRRQPHVCMVRCKAWAVIQDPATMILLKQLPGRQDGVFKTLLIKAGDTPGCTPVRGAHT